MGAKDVAESLKHGVLLIASGVDKILAVPDNFAMKSDPLYLPSIQATKALLKFCEEHQGVPDLQLRACLAALQLGDDAQTRKVFKAFHFGASGPFDWFPPIVFDNETEEYVQEVFTALVERWHRLMGQLLK